MQQIRPGELLGFHGPLPRVLASEAESARVTKGDGKRRAHSFLDDEHICCPIEAALYYAVTHLRHGCVQLAAIVIPRPAPLGQPPPPGLGKVIVEYTDMDSALKARNAMHGRKFAGRTVAATFLPEAQYAAGQF